MAVASTPWALTPFALGRGGTRRTRRALHVGAPSDEGLLTVTYAPAVGVGPPDQSGVVEVTIDG